MLKEAKEWTNNIIHAQIGELKNAREKVKSSSPELNQDLASSDPASAKLLEMLDLLKKEEATKLSRRKEKAITGGSTWRKTEGRGGQTIGSYQNQIRVTETAPGAERIWKALSEYNPAVGGTHPPEEKTDMQKIMHFLHTDAEVRKKKADAAQAKI